MAVQAAARPRLLQAMVDAFRQPDVRQKLLFTLAMLIVFRFVAHVPLPNIDRDALSAAFEGNAILDFLSIFSGGALQNLSVAGVNLALTQEADFSSFIQRKGFDALVQFMRDAAA